MKNFLIRSHNIKSKTLPTWPTPNDKTPETVIYDEQNGYAFVIRFGPNPEISIWDKSDKHNLGDEIHSYKVPTEKQKKDAQSKINEILDNLRFGKF